MLIIIDPEFRQIHEKQKSRSPDCHSNSMNLDGRFVGKTNMVNHTLPSNYDKVANGQTELKNTHFGSNLESLSLEP